MLTIK